MADYDTRKVAKQVLLENLIGDNRLGITPDVKAAAEAIKFTGFDKPFLPTPFKFTESICAIAGLVAASAAAITKERYGIDQEVTVDTCVNAYVDHHSKLTLSN